MVYNLYIAVHLYNLYCEAGTLSFGQFYFHNLSIEAGLQGPGQLLQVHFKVDFIAIVLPLYAILIKYIALENSILSLKSTAYGRLSIPE